MLEVGSIVGGKFRIERMLGEGGMGLVAIATHLQLDQLVALKVLRDPMLGDAEVVERFMREARASARLRSEHVCKVSDVGQLDDGAPYLVMELLEGSDLAGVVSVGTLPIATACEYVLQACVAIAEAHTLGIVHRDLKPANLFLTRRLDGSPLVKVLDFGIAKAASAGDFKITRTSTIMGSPGYMSPEQLRSARDADARSDIWALGVILYELVSGHLPFRGDSITELAVKVVVDPPEPLVVDSPAFAAIVARCLAKDPAQRYPDVAAFAADLAPLAGETGTRTATLVAAVSRSSPRRHTVTVQPVVQGGAPTQHTGIQPGAAPGPGPGSAVATSPLPMGSAPTAASHAALGVAASASAAGLPHSPGGGTALGVGPSAVGTAPSQAAMQAASASSPAGSPSQAMPFAAANPSAVGTAPSTEGYQASAPPGATSGSSTALPSAPPSRKRAILFAVLTAALAAVASGVVVFAMRDPRPRHARRDPIAQIDGPGSAAASPPPDANAANGALPGSGSGLAPSVDAGITAENAELRTKLHALADKQDWYAVLQLSDLDHDDPEIMKLVAAARPPYIAQQARAIDAQVRQGQCTRAKELATAALQVVPDDTTLGPRARACKPHVGTPAAPPATLDDASAALARTDYARALELAEQLLKADPHSEPAIRIAAIAACGTKNVDKATRYAGELRGADHAAARNLCRKNNIELGAGPNPPGPPGPPRPPDGDEPDGDRPGLLDDAQRAEQSGQWDKALAFAQATLKHNPRSMPALIIGITAACRLGKEKTARDLFRGAPRLRQGRLRQLCADQGIEL